jgi:DNA invertase Pin-like site-specific DNA recombinase
MMPYVLRPARYTRFGIGGTLDECRGVAHHLVVLLLDHQDVAGQTMRLTQVGAVKVFTDARSGKTMERPGLEALLAYARNGDTFAVVRLDRIGRSLGELLSTVAMLKERGIALVSLEEMAPSV